GALAQFNSRMEMLTSPRSGRRHKARGERSEPRERSKFDHASPRSGRRPSEVTFIEFDLVRDQEPEEFIPKRNLLMMLFLTGNVFTYLTYIRLAHSECSIASLPGKIFKSGKHSMHPTAGIRLQFS